MIAACEEWVKERGLKVMIIGVLDGNTRARAVYDGAGFGSYVHLLRKYVR